MKARFICLIAALMVAASLQAAEPGSLRVLFVGIDPARVATTDMDTFMGNPELSVALRKARTASFEALLRQYFKTVKVVYAADYREEMSNHYEVTIFDALPPAIKKSVRETDPVTGATTRFEPAEYLTARFDAAAILISTVSAQISEPLQYKMDWLCQCLAGDAHGMKLEHPVFTSPYKVNPTIQYRPTPKNYREYYAGRDLPDALPMWRVQKVSFVDRKGFPPGLVSSGPGFTEGHDAEIISYGVSEKSQNSVALARHANFFHWGFSASPQDMTDEAKRVFVNAVYYIARFKGQRPYSHRPNRSAWSNRGVSLDSAYRLSKQTYESWIKEQQENDPASEDYARQVKKSGIKLSAAELKAMVPPRPKLPNQEQWLKDEALKLQPASAVALFGTHLDQYLPYYEANLGYLRPGTTKLTFEVDQDVRSLGVANSDVELLELCVAMLESNLDPAKATRILVRYTGENFKSAQQWRQWLDSNRSLLYFSDEDGYRFHLAPAALRKAS